MTDNAQQSSLERRQRITAGDEMEWLARMFEIRHVENGVQQMFSDGHIDGTTHTCQGQEAVSIGVAAALRPSDVVACTYRGHGHALALGVTPAKVLGEIAGRSTGTMGGLGGSMHLSDLDVGLLPTFAIVGAGIPVAVGAALAAQVQGRDEVGVAIFGDGAVNIGAFHEGLNLAAVWSAPCVFIIENNLYAEYSPLRTTTPIDDLADRASSYGMPGRAVDGQDVAAVHSAVHDAVERARGGGGPTLLEMKTYRFAGHSRSDQALYRPEGELERWLERDPITLLRNDLIAQGRCDQEQLTFLEAEISEEVQRVIAETLAAPQPAREQMFDNVYA